MIEGYNIVRSEHSLNSRRDGVGLYYKNSLVLKIFSRMHRFSGTNLKKAMQFHFFISIT